MPGENSESFDHHTWAASILMKFAGCHTLVPFVMFKCHSRIINHVQKRINRADSQEAWQYKFVVVAVQLGLCFVGDTVHDA